MYQSSHIQHSQFYFILSNVIFCKQKYVSKLCLYCRFELVQVKLFFVTMVLDMQIQNLIHFNSIQLIQYLDYFRSKIKLFHSTMVLDLTIQNSIHLNMIEIKSVYFKSIQFNLIRFKSIQLFAFQLCQYLNYFRSNFLSPPWS